MEESLYEMSTAVMQIGLQLEVELYCDPRGMMQIMWAEPASP